MNNSLLCAYRFDQSSEAQSPSPFDKVLETQSPHWCHFDANELAEESIKQLPFDVPEVVIEALVAEETRPRLALFEGSFFLNLRGINLNDESDPEDMVSIRIWSDGINLVSTRRRRLKAVDDIKSSFAEGNGPKSVSEFLAVLVGYITVRMEPIVEKLEEQVESFEEHFLDDSNSIDAVGLLDVRRRVVVLRRYMIPQKEALFGLVNNKLGVLEEDHKIRLNEGLNRLNLYLENLDALRERAHLIKEEVAANAAAKMNNNMYVLSIIAAIFLPLGFLTGLLGINVGGIPGAENSNAFLIFCAFLGLVVIVQILAFKRKKWF